MIFALVLQSLLTVTPAPSPTPLRTIEQMRATPLCNAMHHVLPVFLNALEQNDKRAAAIADHSAKMSEWNRAGATDGPALTLHAADIDQLAAQMYDNLSEVDDALRRSYSATPQGRDPSLDSLRNRIQTIVDVERIMADRYESMTGAAGSQSGPKETSFRFIQAVRAEIARNYGSTPPPTYAFETQTPSPYFPSPPPGAPVLATPTPAPPAESLTGSLRELRLQLLPIALDAADQCGIK